MYLMSKRYSRLRQPCRLGAGGSAVAGAPVGARQAARGGAGGGHRATSRGRERPAVAGRGGEPAPPVGSACGSGLGGLLGLLDRLGPGRRLALSVPGLHRLMTFSTATRVGPFFLPRYCGVRSSAVFGEDLADRGVVEERVLEVGDRRVLVERRLRGQVADLLEDLDLLLRLDQPLENLYASSTFLPCFGMVRNEPPQLPPPPGIAAMSHLPCGVRRGVLDVAEHPRRAGEHGEVALDEARVPLRREAGQVGRQAGVDRLDA